MTSTIDAARQIQRRAEGYQTFHRCNGCSKVLSIPEFIERHCEGCGSEDRPVAVKEKAA